MNTNLKQAEAKTIFYIDAQEIKSTNLAEFIFESLEKIRVSRIIKPTIYVREIQDEDGDVIRYDIYKYGVGGNSRLQKSFQTLDEAEQYGFECACIDFKNDKDRDTQYFETIEEAEKELQARIETAKNLAVKEEFIETHRKQKYLILKRKV
jgi:hypothetical protein